MLEMGQQESVPQTEAGVELASDPPKRSPKKTTRKAGENTEMASPAPSDRSLEAPVLDPPERRQKKTTEPVGEHAEVAGLTPSDRSLEVPAKGTPKRRRKKTGDPVTEDVKTAVKEPSFANGEASSAL